ncbi:MAG TPA: sugar phosphate isomerase/epimerase family protein [Planctomycetota bacterium]|nr:sugar phosphate isomerase/epimerase family protein [Planctomycetota bacterium]
MKTLPFRLGYATSGFAHHRLEDALLVLAKIGYRAVSLTLDVAHLDPFARDLPSRVRALAAILRELDFAVVVETGARFLLDRETKHAPTLLSREGGDRREAFLATAIEVAAELGADAVSLWSGAKDPDQSDAEADGRLLDRLGRTIARAQRAGVDLAFEPEPGMHVATVAQWRALDAALGAPARFGVALDVGHVLANDEGDPAAATRGLADRLVTVAIEDMRRGVHEHLPFGEGHLDVPAVFDALEDAAYARIVSVELPRQSHDAVRTARRSAEILSALGAELRPR